MIEQQLISPFQFPAQGQTIGLSISVVVCAYTIDRWDDLLTAVEALQGQDEPPAEIIVVIDHNPDLFSRAVKQFPGVSVVENAGSRGLSGARNTAIPLASGEIIAFMDEDAIPDPDWLSRLVSGYDNEDVVGVGGFTEPLWDAGRPGWFPEEFDWVVGCSFRGLGNVRTPVRNLIGCNMSFRRELFKEIGGFNSNIGRPFLVGLEDTEFCIRATQTQPDSKMLYLPEARIRHHVPASRGKWGYFKKRCYAEGYSKAFMTRLVGKQAGLSTERKYTFSTLPRGVVNGLYQGIFSRDFNGFRKTLAILTGLIWTTAGYAVGSFTFYRRKPPDSTAKFFKV